MRSRTLISPPIVTAALALLMAGCGGSPAAAGASGQSGLVAYARCMRSHGLPAFPDPTGGQGIPKDRLPIGNPNFSTASQACQHVMPAGGLGPATTSRQRHTRVAAGIAFARCIRSHGFPSFPDPTTSGQFTHPMLASAGINLHQPAVLDAADACTSVTHGLITKSGVASFVAGR